MQLISCGDRTEVACLCSEECRGVQIEADEATEQKEKPHFTKLA
jgi:hypothetical protein